MNTEKIINLADATWELSNYLMRLQNEPGKHSLCLQIILAVSYTATEIQREVRGVRPANTEIIQDTIIWAREEIHKLKAKEQL